MVFVHRQNEQSPSKRELSVAHFAAQTNLDFMGCLLSKEHKPRPFDEWFVKPKKELPKEEIRANFEARKFKVLE